ncbi:hypothetical protein ACQ4PT_060123 [Festuca glaucescens]
MATRNILPPRTGPSSNPPLRQPVPPRSTPVRADARGADNTNLAAMQATIPGHGSDGQGDLQLRPVAPEQGAMSSMGGGRQAERRDEGFNGLGFGGFDEGYYEGNNGYGNGYGYMNKGNYRQRPYRQQYFRGNRGRSSNFRGGSGRFNGNGNRFQRYFNNNENAVATSSAQSQDGNATQVVAHSAGLSEAHPSSQNIETSSSDSLLTRAQKKIDKMVCLRCGENGHLAESCLDVLCIYCEKISHPSSSCALLSMPKPVAITYGVSRNELMFHEVPASSDVTFRHDSGKVGKISVTDGVLSSQEIAKELEWIIPGNHQWDLWPTEDGAFKVIFPTKADLARMTKIINVPVSGTSMFLHFEEWSAADLDPFCLTKALEIDMVYTRAHSDVRMLVEVTRVENIPTTTVDHTYDGKGYGLLFKVEGEKGKEKSDETMQEANPEDDSKGSAIQDNESFKKDEHPPMGGPAKSSMNDSNPPKSDFPAKQTHDLSLPVLRVGMIDCLQSTPSVFRSKSESWVIDLVPRRLWGDCDSVDDGSLPSPLPKLSSHFDAEVETPFVDSAVHITAGNPTVLSAVIGSFAAATGNSVSFDATPENLAVVSAEAGKAVCFATAAGKTGSCSAETDCKSPANTLIVDAQEVEHGLQNIKLAHGLEQEFLKVHSPTVQTTKTATCGSQRVLEVPSQSQITTPQGCIKGVNNSAFEHTYSPNNLKGSPKGGISNNTNSEPLNQDITYDSTSVTSMLNEPLSTNHVSHPEVKYSGNGTGVFLGGRFSMEDVMAYGGIASPATEVRSSERIRQQYNADATQLDRA